MNQIKGNSSYYIKANRMSGKVIPMLNINNILGKKMV